MRRSDPTNPPTLEQLGREAGCSPFYLSRTFSKETGQTIPQYLRQLRLDRAASLLKQGQMNVTEVALEVGYNSLSHFSQAFHQQFGCCPGLYPVATPTQQAAGKALKAWNAAPASLRVIVGILVDGRALFIDWDSVANRFE